MRERKIEKYLIKSPKQMIMVIAVFTLMIFVGGTTYAFFNYTRTGGANTVSVGRISFVSSQSSGSDNKITLSNVFPIATSAVSTDTNNVGTLEIAVTGDTDYSGGIEYLVSSTNTNITTSTGKLVPLSLQVSVNGLGTSSNNYFTERESTTSNIYKKIVGDALVGDQMLLVGFITPNNPTGTIAGVNGTITIKAYFDESKILISDTYDGTESDNMGTPNSIAQGKTVLTTTEWNALSSSGISFQIKVEANEGIWVKGSLEEIMRQENFDTTKNRGILDNESSEFVSASTGIDFGSVSSDTNGKGVYMRVGTQNDSNPILYYRGAVENNNVVFNNKCWKAVRTTDTGGVKLIYNGEQSHIYSKEFTDPDTYLSENEKDIFTFDNTDSTWNYEVNDGANHEISFKVPNGDNYNIVITGTTGSTCGYSLIVQKDGNNLGVTGGGGGQAINFTQSFGTLTIQNVIKVFISAPSTSQSCSINFKISMQQNTTKLLKNNYSVLTTKSTDEMGCDNDGVSTALTNFVQYNVNTNSPAYSGYMYGTVYEYNTSNWASGARFGSGFTWNGTNYNLVDDSVTIPNATHHYSCNLSTENGTCEQIRYVYYVEGSTKYYITLTGGDGIEQAIVKMQTNITSSNAKNQIDTWYADNMNMVTNKLEDTIWCNDRSIAKYNGWSPIGLWGTESDGLFYGTKERSNYASDSSTLKNQPSLTCSNKNDAFTVKNASGNQKLQYPVALLTEDEIVLAGGLSESYSTFYLKSSINYWSMSPVAYYSTLAYNCYGFIINSNGGTEQAVLSLAFGLRPSISIKPGLLVIKGTGIAIDPYVIE